MSTTFSKNLFLAAALAILIAVGFWQWAPSKKPALPTFKTSVAESLDDGIARYGAEGFAKKNEQEFRDAFAKFQANGPKVPGMPKAK
ncbi:hypothetical protein [Mesorhizobium sp. 128a]